MNGAHAVGAGAGAVVALVLLKVFGWSLSDSDALLLGGAVVAVGTTIGHAVSNYGIKGLLGRIWHGPAPAEQPPAA